MIFGKNRRETAIQKELLLVRKQEEKMTASAMKEKGLSWKNSLENKIPEKVYNGLETAFCKAFSMVFDQGRGIIEKSYNKAELLENQSIRDYAFHVKGRRKELKQVHKNARQADFLNLAMTTAEGLGLGALGIGMPDIVLFISTLLRGIYETALNYGFEYEGRAEQVLILKMMAASLSRGEERELMDREVDELLLMPGTKMTEERFQAQLRETASAFAMDMLLLKFIQGLPIIGIVGGAANPVYYRKVMQYVQLKYKKRYLMKLL